MRVLIHGTKDSSSENYADRILAAISTIAFTRYGKRAVVLQTSAKLPVEKVLTGNFKKTTAIKTQEFSFSDNGMDALWKRIRSGVISKEDWADCCKNIAKDDNKLDVAEVSTNEDFTNMIFNQFDTFKNMIMSADAVYDIVFIFVDGNNEELIKKMYECYVDDGALIDKEIICVPQGPKKDCTPHSNTMYAVKNFDLNSCFNEKSMSDIYGSKYIYPFPYNIGYKDACLKESALKYLSTNVSPSEDDDNYEFVSYVSKMVSDLLGINIEPSLKEKNFVR